MAWVRSVGSRQPPYGNTAIEATEQPWSYRLRNNELAEAMTPDCCGGWQAPGMVSLAQTWLVFPKDNCFDLEATRSTYFTGDLLIATLHYPRHRTLPEAFVSLMRIPRVCLHANVGWPIRCDGEKVPSQHCFDCGAQRAYLLQPLMQKGPMETAGTMLPLSSRNRLPIKCAKWSGTAGTARDILVG
jgi:hypothetical protein